MARALHSTSSADDGSGALHRGRFSLRGASAVVHPVLEGRPGSATRRDPSAKANALHRAPVDERDDRAGREHELELHRRSVMSRIRLSRAALCAALAGAAACSTPTFTATGRFASEKGPACVYCSGGTRDYFAPRMADRAPVPATPGGLAR